MKNGKLLTITKFFLYLSSFLPLFILLIVQNIKIRNEDGIFYNFEQFMDQFFFKGFASSEGIFWIAVFFFIVASLISILFFFYFFINTDGVPQALTSSNYGRADTLGYIVTYIVPLMSMNIGSYRSLVINFGLFFIIGIFYIKNNQFFMNPIFNLLGYNILSSDNGCVYITKLSPRRMKEIAEDAEEVSLKTITTDIFVVKEI